jgi:hypothetical protein
MFRGQTLRRLPVAGRMPTVRERERQALPPASNKTIPDYSSNQSASRKLLAGRA